MLLSVGSVACGENKDVLGEDVQQARKNTSKRCGSKSGQKKGASSKSRKEIEYVNRRKDVSKSKEPPSPAKHCLDVEEATQNAPSNLSSHLRSNTTASQEQKNVLEQPDNEGIITACTADPVDTIVATNQTIFQQNTPMREIMHCQDVDTIIPDASHSFSVKLKPEIRANRRHNFVLVELTYASSMQLQNFFVTASLSDEKGIVRGCSSKKNTRFMYKKELNQCNLNALFLQDVKKKDESLSHSQTISFRVRVEPSSAIEPPGELTMDVRYTDAQMGEAHTYTVTKRVSLDVQAKSPRLQKHVKRTSSKQ